MEDSDISKKRQQAAQVYSGMTDGELQQLAAEADTLTEIGKYALSVESARRGLKVQFSDVAVTSPSPITGDLVTIRRFRDLTEAVVAKGVLDSAGIESFLGDDNTIRMDWLWSNALGGVKLWVRNEDVQGAIQILDNDISDKPDTGTV